MTIPLLLSTLNVCKIVMLSIGVKINCCCCWKLMSISKSWFLLLYEGIKIEGVSTSKKMKGILLDTTMDSRGRSACLSIRQFNGYNGCQTCTEPGEQLDLGPGKKNARRQCHIYIHSMQNMHKQLDMQESESMTWWSTRLLLPCSKFPRKERSRWLIITEQY